MLSQPVDAGGWHQLQTEHFVLFYLPRQSATAHRVRDGVEAVLRQRWRYFSASTAERRWSKRCQIFIYPTQRQLIRMTGGNPKAGSASTRASKLYHGRILERRINLAADDPRLFHTTLPHEVTHIVVGELMGGEVPRWANEGLATLAEPKRSLRRYRRLVAQADRRGQLIAVDTLMALEAYPRGGWQLLFYAQSAVLTDFLVRRKNPEQFLLFLEMAKLYDYRQALWAVYQLRGSSSLQSAFTATVKQNP